MQCVCVPDKFSRLLQNFTNSKDGFIHWSHIAFNTFVNFWAQVVFLYLIHLFRSSFSLSKHVWSLTDPVQKQWRSSPQHMKPAQKLCWWPNFFHSDWKIIDDRNCSEVKIARTPMSESLWDWEEKSVEVLARGWFWCNWDVADSLFSSNTHSSRSSSTNWASSKTVVTFSHRRILVQILTPIQTWLEPCKKVMVQTRVLPVWSRPPPPASMDTSNFRQRRFGRIMEQSVINDNNGSKFDLQMVNKKQ